MDIIDELTYRNYRYNRKLAPWITAQEWVRVYGPAALKMEERYIAELTDKLVEYYDHQYDGTGQPAWVLDAQDEIAKAAGITEPRTAWEYVCRVVDQRIKEVEHA